MISYNPKKDKNIIWDDFEYAKNPTQYRKEYSKDKLDEIYGIIKIWTIRYDGISHNELAKQARLYRKNLAKYIDKLISYNLITREKGLRGKYIASIKSFDNYDGYFILQILTERFKNILFKEKTSNEYFVLNSKSNVLVFSKDGNSCNEYDFTKYKQFFEPKFTSENKLEKDIFELSNLIGAYIIYLIIYSLNHDVNAEEDKFELSKKFVEKGIISILGHLIKFPIFENIKNNPQKILSAFTMLYPLLSYKFERVLTNKNQFADILEDWPTPLRAYKEFHKQITNQRKKEQNCKHNYSLFMQHVDGTLDKVIHDDEIDNYTDIKKWKKEADSYVKICSICNHKKKIRLKRDSKI